MNNQLTQAELIDLAKQAGFKETSGWWTFFTCAMFILWVAGAGARMTKTTIKTKAQAVSWANNLPEDAEVTHATK